MSLQAIVKTLGGVSIMVAGVSFGKHLASRLVLRLRLLEDLRAGLERLATEIGYARSPLREALEAVGRLSGTRCSAFFDVVTESLRQSDGLPASHAWSEGVSQLAQSGVLTDGDSQAIELLGPSLGASSGDEQVRHLHSAIGRLTVQVEQARAEARKYDTFYQEMGALVAVAIVLLLL